MPKHNWKIGRDAKEKLKNFSQLSIMEPRQFVIDLERCRGMYLKTTDNQEIFDWAGYYGSKLIEHNHLDTLNDQKYNRKLLAAANNKISHPDFTSDAIIEYYALLKRIAPKCLNNDDMKIFTVNSGAEAVENALKYMIKLNAIKRGIEHLENHIHDFSFICFEGGFHGRTVYALGVTDMPHNRNATRNFQNLSHIRNHKICFSADRLLTYKDIKFVLNNIESVLKNTHNVAGIIIEPLQSASGHKTAPKWFFQELSSLAYEHKTSLCFDEVQTAGGQTGTIFMCDQFDLPNSPDVVVTAKKFGCGVVYMKKSLPIQGVFDSTWSGHIVDMVRFVKEWEIVEKEKLIEDVDKKALMFNQRLMKLESTFPNLVRVLPGVGLYQAIQLLNPIKKNQFIAEALAKHSLLLLGSGTDCIRFRPTLSVKRCDISELINLLEDLFKNYTDYCTIT